MEPSLHNVDPPLTTSGKRLCFHFFKKGKGQLVWDEGVSGFLEPSNKDFWIFGSLYIWISPSVFLDLGIYAIGSTQFPSW